jgi:hypothetical protein
MLERRGEHDALAGSESSEFCPPVLAEANSLGHGDHVCLLEEAMDDLDVSIAEHGLVEVAGSLVCH